MIYQKLLKIMNHFVSEFDDEFFESLEEWYEGLII